MWSVPLDTSSHYSICQLWNDVLQQIPSRLKFKNRIKAGLSVYMWVDTYHSWKSTATTLVYLYSIIKKFFYTVLSNVLTVLSN